MKSQVNGLGKKQEVDKRVGYHISFAEVGDAGSLSGDEQYETAIVTSEGFYILNGDHRKEYENCSSLNECMDYFKSKPDLKSTWSN